MKRPGGRNIRVFALVGLGIPILCATGVFVNYFLGKRAQSETVAKLRASGFPTEVGDLRHPDLPPSQNAAPLYQAWAAKVGADSKLRQAVDDYSYGLRPTSDSRQRARSAAAIKAIQPYLPEISAITARPKCHFQWNYAQDMESMVADYTRVREVGVVLVRTATLRSESADWKSALEFLRQALVTVDHVRQSPSELGIVISTGLESAVSKSLGRMIYRHHQDRNFIVAARQLIKAYPAYPDLRTVVEVECVIGRSVLLQQRDFGELQKLGGNDTSLPAQGAVLTFAALRDSAAARLTQFYADVEPKLPRSPSDWDEPTLALVNMRQALDREANPASAISSLFVPKFDSLRESFQKIEAQRSMLRAGLTAYTHRSPRQVIPPKDPYSGKAMLTHFEKDHMFLYAVGPNRRDDGGRFGKGRDDVRVVFGPASWKEQDFD